MSDVGHIKKIMWMTKQQNQIQNQIWLVNWIWITFMCSQNIYFSLFLIPLCVWACMSQACFCYRFCVTVLVWPLTFVAFSCQHTEWSTCIFMRVFVRLLHYLPSPLLSQQLLREMQQMASRPFATINVALETDEEPPDLIGGNVKVSVTFCGIMAGSECVLMTEFFIRLDITAHHD